MPSIHFHIMTDESDNNSSNLSDISYLRDESNINTSNSLLYRKGRLLVPASLKGNNYNYFINDSTSESDCFASDCELNSDQDKNVKLIRYNDYVYNVWKRNNYRSWKPVSGNYMDPNILNIRHNAFFKSQVFTNSFDELKTNNQNLLINIRNCSSNSILKSNQLSDKSTLNYLSTNDNMPRKNSVSSTILTLSSSKRKRKSTEKLENDESMTTKRTKFSDEPDTVVKRKQTVISNLVSKTNKSKEHYDTDSSADVFIRRSSRPNEKINTVNVENVVAVNKLIPAQKRLSSGYVSHDEGISVDCRADLSSSDISRLGTQEINFDAGIVSGRSRKDSISQSSCGSNYDETVVKAVKSKNGDLIDASPSLLEMPNSFSTRTIYNKSHGKFETSKNTRHSTSLNENDRLKLLPHSDKSPTKNNKKLLEKSRNSSASWKDTDKNRNGSKTKMSIDRSRRLSLSSSDGYDDNRREEMSRNSSELYSEDGEVIDNSSRYETPSSRHRRSSSSSNNYENNQSKERSKSSSKLHSEVSIKRTPNMNIPRRSSNSSENDTTENASRDPRRRQTSVSSRGGSDTTRNDVTDKRGSLVLSDVTDFSDNPDEERMKNKRKSSSSKPTSVNPDINLTVMKEKAKKSIRDLSLLQTPSFNNSLKSKATSTPFFNRANDKRIESCNVQNDEAASCSTDEENSVYNKVDSYRRNVIPEAIKNISSKLAQGITSEQFEEDLLFVEDISDSDEIWVAQCPKSFKVESLLGKKFDLNGVTTLSGSTEDGDDDAVHYEAFTSSSVPNNEQNTAVNNVYCLIPSREQQKLKLEAIKTKGTIKIEERIAVPTANTIKFTSSAEISLPECLKIRHPLLGSDFSEQLKVLEYLGTRCNLAGEKSFNKSHKNRKKSKRNRFVSETISDGNDEQQMLFDNAVDADYDTKQEKKKHKKSSSKDANHDSNSDLCPSEGETEQYKKKKKKKKKQHSDLYFDD